MLLSLLRLIPYQRQVLPAQQPLAATVSLTATATPPLGAGGTYAWSGGDTPTTDANTFGTSGTYTVTVTNADGCTASTDIVVVVNTAPTAGISGTATACTTVSLTATATPPLGAGGTYAWSGGDTPTTDANTFNTSGTYTVTVTNAAGCTASTDIAVVVNTVPTAGITGTGTGCGTVSLTATATPPLGAGGTYAWSNGTTLMPTRLAQAALIP